MNEVNWNEGLTKEIDRKASHILKKRDDKANRLNKDTVSFALNTFLKNLDQVDESMLSRALKGMNGHLKGDRKELLIVALNEIVR